MSISPLKAVDLSLCMIVRDEEENLDACLRSVKEHVDEIVVVDTGSIDKTGEVAERHGARVHPFDARTNPEAFFADDEATCAKFGAPGPYLGSVMLGDFGAARRKSFSLARGEFILWLDADDVLEGAAGLRAVVADLRARKLDMGFLAYDYARDDKGRTFYRQWRERIIRAGCADWVNPVHEVLLPSRPVQHARYEGITVAHHRKADRTNCPPHRNYKILLREIEHQRATGQAVDPRTLFYLGQEARWVEPLKSAKFYEDYLGRSGWPEERAAAHVALGSMCEFGQLPMSMEEAYARADREYAVAAAEMPSNPDGLFGLARIAYLRERWQECVDYTQRGLAIGNTESMLGANPMDRLYRPHVYLNYALSKLGRIEEALASCRSALAAMPDDPGVPGGAQGMLIKNVELYEAELAARAGAAPSPPGDQRLVFDRKEDVDAPPQAEIPRDVMAIWSMQLWKQVVHIERDQIKARELLRSLPASLQADEAVARMRASTERRWPKINPVALAEACFVNPPPRTSGNIAPDAGLVGLLDSKITVDTPAPAAQAPSMSGALRIVFWVGPSVEPWDPTTPNTTGIGGSETACIEMARELAARGHDVTVFGDLPGGIGNIFKNVHYHQWQNAAPPIECDVFISSRAPAIMDDVSKIRASVKLLWVHDIHVGDHSPQMERWLLAFDRVLCLSRWHRDFFLGCYPTLDPAKVLVTRNGIDPERFGCLECGGTVHCFNECLGRGNRKKNHLVFSSSPNRGLDTLVMNFPFIRAAVPDAELHVYYGFDCWEKFARVRNAEVELLAIERFKRMLAERAHPGSGIHLHGRVSQRELAQAFMRAKVWPHWTQFTETSCISAMEAQAAGCVPVHSGVAALAETCRYGVRVDSPQAFVDACVRLLTDESHRAPLAEAARHYALSSLSWESLAEEWERMFRRVAEELRLNPLSKYLEIS